MDQNTVITRNAELIETEIDGEMVALDVERGTCLGFNATASRIWALIEQPMSRSVLLTRLGEEFEVDPAECERDVDGLLNELRGQGLVRLDPQEGASARG